MTRDKQRASPPGTGRKKRAGTGPGDAKAGATPGVPGVPGVGLGGSAGALIADVNRQRRADERIRRLAAVVADSNDAVILFDPEGWIQDWNRGAQAIYGWSEEEARRMNVRELAVAGVAEQTAGLVGRLLAGETVRSFETRRRTKDGRVLEIWLTITAVADEAGKATAFATTERDITERKRAEAALLKAKEEGDRQRRRLEAVMEALPVGLAITDERGGNIHANKAFELLWGGPRPATSDVSEYPAYRAWWDDTGEPVDPREWASAQAVQQGHAVLGQLLEIQRFDGQRRQVINSAAPVYDADGAIVGSVVAIQDITELRQAQRSLEESQKRLALAASATRIGMFDWNIASGSVLWTRTHEALFGYAPAEASAPSLTAETTETSPREYRTWADRVHPEDLPRVEELVGRCIRDCSPFEAQYRIVWPDGSTHWIETRAVFLCDAGDTGRGATRMLGVVMDITERKQAEEALRRTSEELARSNKELEQFAYVASHDLQEPLRMIGGFLKLLDDRYRTELDDKAREYIRFAVEGAGRMSSLITDLLAYSKLVSYDKTPGPVDANRPLAAALANLRGSIQEAGATVTHGTLPTVIGDASQLTQLFQNLIGNAVKFCRAGRPCRVEIDAKPQDGGWLFAVRDNGIGIAPEQLERIFVIFRRLHGRDKYPGTGIGLAISKRIVERLGGRIWAESTPGEGSTFFFTLRKP